MEAEEIKILGEALFNGQVKAKKMSVYGTATFE